jgi:hypothetical protein
MRAADLAAVSAAQVMRRHYSRLFEAAVFENGVENPRHLSNDEYLALAAGPRCAARAVTGWRPRGSRSAFRRPALRPRA